MDMHRNQPVPSPQPSQAVSGAGTPDGIIFPSLSRAAATYNSDEMFNPNCKGVRLYVDATVVGGGPGTLVITIQGRDPLTDNWVAITGAVSAAWNAVQTRTLTVYPGLTTAAGTATTNTEANNFLPCAWRINVVVAVNAVTFSIGAEYLL